MPYIVDLPAKCDKIYTMKLSPYGWINTPIIVEYGLAMLNPNDPCKTVCFRVHGIKHTWTIFENQLYRISRGDYASYFKKELEEFRINLLLWIHIPNYWQQQWVRDYYEMFKDRFYDFSEEERAQFEREQEHFKHQQTIIDNYTADSSS